MSPAKPSFVPLISHQIWGEQMSGKISLARIYYPVKVLGPGNRVGIWVNGCRKKCPGCISPELQTCDPAKEIAISDIIRMIKKITGPIDGFTISGGEPFFDPAALNELVLALSGIHEDILIFTGYTVEELKAQNSCAINSVLDTCAAIVDGPFIRELHEETGLRGSSNQKCLVFKFHDKYSEITTENRNLQNVLYDKGVLTIGIP